MLEQIGSRVVDGYCGGGGAGEVQCAEGEADGACSYQGYLVHIPILFSDTDE
jgi:hypothetical protein